MKKLIIFDFDGTLFNSIDDVVLCFNKTLKKHDFSQLTKEEYINCLGGNIDEITSLILGENNSKENIELVKNTYEKYYGNSNHPHTRPFDGIIELLEVLNDKNIKIAINSNRKTDSVKHFTDKYFTDFEFIEIEGHNPNYPSKPDPSGVNRIIKKADVLSRDVIYVGDSAKDILTAENAGIDCVIVKWGYGNINDWENEYVLAVIDEPSQLIDYL